MPQIYVGEVNSLDPGKKIETPPDSQTIECPVDEEQDFFIWAVLYSLFS